MRYFRNLWFEDMKRAHIALYKKALDIRKTLSNMDGVCSGGCWFGFS